jgi:uncharacterized metal-binding protein
MTGSEPTGSYPERVRQEGGGARAVANAEGGDTEPRVLVIPCSGIGKVQGLLGREATYLVVDELAPGEADTVCLALLVREDPEALEKVRRRPCIAVDGCAKACAQKSLEIADGDLRVSVQVAGLLSKHRGAQPGDGSALTDEGWEIAREIAETLASEAKSLESGGEAPQ